MSPGVTSLRVTSLRVTSLRVTSLPGRGSRAARVRPAAVVVMLVLLGGCGTGGGDPARSASPSATASGVPATPEAPDAARSAGSTAPRGAWIPIAAAPLTPRHSAIAVWTGSEVLVLGGCAGGGCAEDGAEHPQDGAAYDPAQDTWREIAPAPVTLRDASVVALGRTVYALIPTDAGQGDVPSLYAYALEADTWRLLATPPVSRPADRVSRLAVVGERIVAWERAPEAGAAARAGLLYDPATDSWSALPADPYGRSDQREMLALPDGRLAYLGVAPPDPKATHFYRAAVLEPGSGQGWEYLPRSNLAPSGRPAAWTVAAGVLVDANAGATSAGGAVPTGGTLEVSTGIWSTLPALPDAGQDPPGWADVTAGDLAVRRGWAYHPRRGTWQQIPAIASGGAEVSEPALAWARDRLFAFGGRVPAVGDYPGVVADAWTWTPPAVEGEASP